MGQLKSSAPFFRPGPPAPLESPDPEILDFLHRRLAGKTLDVGGGMGAYAHALRLKGHDVALAEIDPACLESARAQGIETLDMNTVSWDDLERGFDTIVLVDVLEHVREHRDFLARVSRCARENVLLTVPCNDDFEKLFRQCITYNHIAVSDHLHQFTSDDVKRLFEELGVAPDITPGSHLFPDPILGLLYREMWGTLKGKLALSSVRFFQKRGWLPRLFPSRIFVEARLSRRRG